MNDRDLVKLANEVRRHAYAPYSRFPVGAALLCADGTVVTGVNVESSVNGLSLCAERVAVFKAISEGKKDFVKIAVSCESDHCRPCGACRQVLYEHAPKIEILMGNPDGGFVRTTIAGLLPDAFTFHPEA
jgi:cytidine deaminase